MEFVDHDDEVTKRRIALIHLYNSLPSYASSAFWHAINDPELPLEVLVRCLRRTLVLGDIQGRNRMIEMMILRTQTLNERWAKSVLRNISLQVDERYALVYDLCADLYETLIRAWMDPERPFWEENFLHSLYFTRKHVYRSLMMREGRWHDLQVKQSTRVPRTLVTSLDQRIQQMDKEIGTLDIEDERAQMMLQEVEWSDLFRLVLCLPDRLKAVILLIFWEGRSEKDTAKILGITDRTVRNRVCAAVKLLRQTLLTERAYISYD